MLWGYRGGEIKEPIMRLTGPERVILENQVVIMRSLLTLLPGKAEETNDRARLAERIRDSLAELTQRTPERPPF
jgi:hypothetical protein